MTDIIKQIHDVDSVDIRESICSIIDNAATEINESDIAHLSAEFSVYFKTVFSPGSARALLEIDYPGKNDDQNTKTPRIVIIGDLHNDFNSLATILIKLSLSTYDYFNKALFIFTGDYNDRGRRPLETMRLLHALKSYLCDRCIFMRGNHELIEFSGSMLRAEFSPSDTSQDIMNCYFSPELNTAYAYYLSQLPFIVSLNQAGKKYLISHASIPKDEAFPLFDVQKLKETSLPRDSKSVIYIMLKQMLWGDPVDCDRKLQDSVTRFEFGRLQFDEFMVNNGFDFLVRSHEPVSEGARYMFNDRLITLFSSGCNRNADSAFSDQVKSPVFAIINEEGLIKFENIFDFKISADIEEMEKDNSLYHFVSGVVLAESKKDKIKSDEFCVTDNKQLKKLINIESCLFNNKQKK